jgi:hypothetical protein
MHSIWVCPACSRLSGKSGHIGCTASDGIRQPTPREYAPANHPHGAVEALREIAEADPVDMALDPTWASRVAREALH